jgi:hypothetical protein
MGLWRTDIAECIEVIATETFDEGFITTDEQLTYGDLTVI